MSLQPMFDAADRDGMLAIKRDHGFPFAVGAYVGPVAADNRYVTLPDAIEIFYPHSHIVGIAVHSEYNGTFLDVEKGDAVPTESAPWIRRQLAAGVWRPGIYANKATMPAVKANLAGLPRSSYRLWIADWTGTPHLPAGYDACQWTNNARGGADGPYDSSVLAADFFAKPKPAPKPKPKPKPIHPKVIGATGAAAVTGAVTGLLQAFGLVHLTPAEVSAIHTFAAAVGGWTVPSPKK